MSERQSASVTMAGGRRSGHTGWLRVLLALAQGMVGLFFVVAGINKITNGPGSVLAVFGALGWGESAALARLAAWLEVGLGCWLALGRRPRTAAWVTLVVLTTFSTILMILGDRVGWGERCGCMGPFSKSTILESLIRNGYLMLITIGLLIGYRSRPNLVR